jgi:hypothetical protein
MLSGMIFKQRKLRQVGPVELKTETLKGNTVRVTYPRMTKKNIFARLTK